MGGRGTHDWVLVAMSVMIAIVASYTALDLAGRVRASSGRARRLWLATAAVAMGGGIWAMHFVAMLAYSIPGMGVHYDVTLTLVSLAVPIAVTGISFALTDRAGRHPLVLPAAGLLMGLSVVAMHYIGMAAMMMPATLRYDRLWVSVSVLIAIGAATAALWLSARSSGPARRIGAAMVMGMAISGMHFAGMKAASITMGGPIDRVRGIASLSQTTLAIDVFAASLLILCLALIAAMFDRRFALLAAREAEALRASEERFRSLYRGTPLPLHSLDREGRIEQVSDTWLELTGYSRDEMVGRPLVALLADPADRQIAQDRASLASDGVLADREYRIRTKSGETRDVLFSARVERNAKGEFLHVLGGLTDVTGRKNAEEALRQAQKIEAIGHLTGGVAHDFNNLLAIIIGNLDLAARQVPDDRRAARLIGNAMEGARRGAVLTQRLLAFARKQDLRPESIDVPELVANLSDLLQRALGPMIAIDTRFPPRLPRAQVDAHQLEMAILNMAVNARDAMPDGGTVTIAATEDEIGDDNETLKPGPYVRLDIRDTGIGMDADTLARASEPFFTTKGVGKGTGLGLSMVQGLAAQSDGGLRIVSAPGEGTTIMLWLPVSPAAVVSVAKRAGSGSGSGSGSSTGAPPDIVPLSILAVDDDPLVLGNTAAMLEDLGHHVVTAASGQQALLRLDDGTPFDLIITDQLMPGMTGAQLAASVRERMPHAPVLLVSGFADLTPGEQLALPLLAKPFDRTMLARAVADVRVAAQAQAQAPEAAATAADA